MRRHISFSSELMAFTELMRIVDEEKPDLMHAHSSKAGGLASIVGVLKRVPVVFTVHGWAYTQPRPFLNKIAYWLLSLFVTIFTTKMIAVSEYVKRVTPFSFLLANKITVIKNAIRCDSRPALPHPPTPPYDKLLMTVAELHPTKGLDLLIRALPLLPESLGRVHPAIAGSGEEEKKLRDLIEELNLQTQVSLLGFVQDAHLLIPHADLFVLPSRSEALAYVLLEAGCAGVPALGTHVGGIPEVAPMTVRPTPYALAEGIEKLLTHDAMLKENARVLSEKVRTEFSLDTMIEKTYMIYKTV
jgi:glycosyltransferase involved in cell wall biosynthesis